MSRLSDESRLDLEKENEGLKHELYERKIEPLQLVALAFVVLVVLCVQAWREDQQASLKTESSHQQTIPSELQKKRADEVDESIRRLREANKRMKKWREDDKSVDSSEKRMRDKSD